jgi:hypothetical protein
MARTTTVRDADSTTDANEPAPPTVGGLAHGVVNSTASICFSAGALRAGGNLSEGELEAVARIEQAARLVADMVKRFAGAAEPSSQPARDSESTVDLYEICCEISEEQRRVHGRAIYCRAFGDSRGRWNHARVVELVQMMVDSVTTPSGRDTSLTLLTSGFGRHVRLSVQALGHLSPEAKRACLQIPSKVDPSLGGLVTVTVTSGPGIVVSMHLPR